MTFDLNHFRTESTINSFRPNTPSNRQETQRLSGSVAYNQTTFGNQSFSLQATHAINSYDDTENDSKNNSIRIGYNIPIEETRRLGAFTEMSRTEFDTLNFNDYDKNTLGTYFESQLANATLEIELGYTQTDQEFGHVDNVSGITGRLRLERGVGTVLPWSISIDRAISDRSSLLERGTLDEIEFIPLDNSDTATVFVQTDANFTVSPQFGRNQITATISIGEENYESILRDRRSKKLSLNVARQVSANTILNVGGQYADEQFLDQNQKDEVTNATINLRVESSRRTHLRFGLNYVKRSSNANGTSYEEIIGQIAFSYALVDKF